MKKNLIILTLLALFLYSCGKDDEIPVENGDDKKVETKVSMTESIPGIEGTWKWQYTVVGGYVGIYSAEVSNPDCVLILEEGNLMSIKDGDEYVIYQEEFKVTKPDNIPLIKNSEIPAGDYLIELPENVQNVIKEYLIGLDNGYHEIYVDGYVSIWTENDAPMLNIIKNPNLEIDDGNYLGSHFVR